MLSYRYLFDIALILLSTKVLGLVTQKFSMPQVVGALLAGLLLGPAGFDILQETDFLKQVAELGVIVLMFTAGLETDLNELKKTGKASFIIALFGVLVPLLLGFITASIFTQSITSDGVNQILQNIFIGIVLTATSVSITVETLKELGKLNTRAGNAILGAAIIDDILGIIALTMITSCADSSVNIQLVLGKIALFFVFAIVVGVLFYKIFKFWVQCYGRDMRRFVVISFVFCLITAFLAEEWFGVADITGAFIAGVVLSNTPCVHYITTRFETISYMLLSPIFFASIGIQVDLSQTDRSLFGFTIILVLVAIISKVWGCSIGARFCHYPKREALQVGVGMVSRGEVALIIASKGAALGLLSTVMFGPIVVMVVITTIITPILLRWVFHSNTKYNDTMKANSRLIKS